MTGSTSQDRVRQVIAGEFAWTELDEDERAAANAQIDRATTERAAATSLGQDLLDAGHDAVVLDVDGRLVRLHPGGTVNHL